MNVPAVITLAPMTDVEVARARSGTALGLAEQPRTVLAGGLGPGFSVRAVLDDPG